MNRTADRAGGAAHQAVAARVRAIELPPFDPLNLRAAELRACGHRVISLGQALPFFAPPAAALEAAVAALGRDEVHRYSTDPGLPSLRRALASRLAAETGDAIDAADLVVTAGANHAFTLALTTLVSPGDHVVLPSPYFTNHEMAVCALGAIPVEAPVADRRTFAVTWSDIEPHLSAHTRAIVLCTPSNPTGATLAAPEGDRIVAEAAARGIVVISDETYRHFVHDGDPWSAASCRHWRGNVAVVGTFSKSFGMMGWRVGFLLADAGICEQAVKVQDAMIICAPVISQMAAEGAVVHAWSHAASYRDAFLERRRVMVEGLAAIPALSWVPTRGGIFAFAAVSGCTDSAALSHALLEQAHVVTLPGSAFGRAGEGHLRLSYGYASMEDLHEALARLRRYFARVG